ncbi:MAG TPA: hypothetical protein P5116_08435 [Eubacteriales bacterium]|nr:hypothetical protein [Eubacteriales bacterium]
MRASKYFKDYDVETTVGKNGKPKRNYVYKGNLYERQATQSRRTAERYAYVLMSIAALALLVMAMVRGIEPNNGGFVAMVSLITLVPAFFVIIGSVIVLFDKPKLTRTEYRDRVLLLKVLPLTTAALALTLSIGYSLYDGGLASCLYCALVAIIHAGIGVNEILVKYSTEKGSKSSDEPERSGIRDRFRLR